MKKQKLELTWIGKEERLRLIRAVIPAQAGIQNGIVGYDEGIWTPACAGVTRGNAGVTDEMAGRGI